MKGAKALALLQGGLVVRDPDKSFARSCYAIEKETGNIITGDFPYSKFMEILKCMKEEQKEHKANMKKNRFRKSWR